MRNYYLFEQAMLAGSIPALEEGISNLNTIFINRDEGRENFLCNPTIWECDTSQGIIYEMYGGIVNAELQRVIPFLFGSFTTIETVFMDNLQMDAEFPYDCNAFTGIDFSHTQIQHDRRVYDQATYTAFVMTCLKYGSIRNEGEMHINLSILYTNFIFTERATTEILEWKNGNSGLYDRLFELFDDIPQHPFNGGIGETEILRYIQGASKRINQAHRVTYQLKGGVITILSCSGHYD